MRARGGTMRQSGRSTTKSAACSIMPIPISAPCSWRRSRRGAASARCLSLQWSQIRHDEKGEARWLLLPATKTKSGEMRMVPIGDRLRAELSMRRHAVDGKAHPASRLRVRRRNGRHRCKSIRRQWEDAVFRAQRPHADPTPRQADAGITSGVSSGRVSMCTICGASLRADCSNRRPISMTCRCSSGTLISRRRAAICRARRCASHAPWRNSKRIY